MFIFLLSELTKYEEVVGYIIRDENVVDTSNYTGTMQLVTEDATRVSKSGTIAKFVSSSEDAIMKKIEELDKQIQDAMESEQTIYPSDVKALESSIKI